MRMYITKLTWLQSAIKNTTPEPAVSARNHALGVTKPMSVGPPRANWNSVKFAEVYCSRCRGSTEEQSGGPMFMLFQVDSSFTRWEDLHAYDLQHHSGGSYLSSHVPLIGRKKVYGTCFLVNPLMAGYPRTLTPELPMRHVHHCMGAGYSPCGG